MSTAGVGVAQVPPVAKRSPLDDIIVTVFAFLGFGGALFLPLKYHVPPIMLSFLAATGIAALVYRFLGGVAGTSLTVGALKATGALAALAGIALVIHVPLVDEVPFQLIKDNDILGPWKWVYARGASSGHLYFSRDAKGNLTFTGDQEKYTSENQYTRLYTITNGNAKLIDRNALELEADVEDSVNHANMHWKADAPLSLLPAFRGTMRATRLPDGSVITDTWGIMFYK